MSVQNFLLRPASRYEIRCYTNRDILTDPAAFEETGILVHNSFTPKPLSYGQRQTCTVGVPWPNEVFYYAVVSVDAAGNRSPISNIISVYISEGEAAEAAEVESQEPLYEGAELASPGKRGLARLRTRRLKTYIAVGVVCGLVLIVFVLVTVILVRVKKRRKAQYDAERRDSYKAYEPNGDEKEAAAANKNLSSWLDSLPRSERGHIEPDITLEGAAQGTLPKQHTLTKTNPYRHKVLTNGSFLNLKDLPAASSGSSSADDSRPTTSTEDSSEGRDGGSSQHSADDHANVSRNFESELEQGRSRVKRSKSSGHHHQQQQQSASVLDTSTARAIIDTYSGNLFSENYSNYVPYGSPAPIHHPHHHDGGNYAAGYGSNGFDRYSVDNVDYSPQRQSFRLRTESVV